MLRVWVRAAAALFITTYVMCGQPTCQRLEPGSTVVLSKDIYSAKGQLNLDLTLRSGVDSHGHKTYCYLTPDGVEAPTLRVRPGDELVLRLKNGLEEEAGAPAHHGGGSGNACAGAAMTAASTNLHFHGMLVPPTCHQDETLKTLIGPSDPPFEYRIKIPPDHAPGLYWYHPHPHGFSEEQVLGGASGALIIEGIETVNATVADLRERVIVLRDQLATPPPAPPPGSKDAVVDNDARLDMSINYVPIAAPAFVPAEITTSTAKREFWRVVNASADTYYDLQLRKPLDVPASTVNAEKGYGARDISLMHLYHLTESDGEPLELIAVDGSPVGAGMSQRTSLLIPPGGRAEFVVTTPGPHALYHLITREYRRGQEGAPNYGRVIANVRPVNDAAALGRFMPSASQTNWKFKGLTDLAQDRVRTLYFSQDVKDPKRAVYFITVEGREPKVFNMAEEKADLVVNQGSVEDWVIENRALEAHAFHIHQLHFQLLERNGKKLEDAALRDVIDLPPWNGKGSYPSVKLRMDFRGPETVGRFVFHCHILEHEDKGMMGSIEVLPAKQATKQP